MQHNTVHRNYNRHTNVSAMSGSIWNRTNLYTGEKQNKFLQMCTNIGNEYVYIYAYSQEIHCKCLRMFSNPRAKYLVKTCTTESCSWFCTWLILRLLLIPARNSFKSILIPMKLRNNFKCESIDSTRVLKFF